MTNRWLVRTPTGDFWVRLARAEDPGSLRDTRTMKQVWFFAERELESRDLEAVNAAVSLCAQLSSARTQSLHHQDAQYRINELRCILDAEFQSGRLVCEPARQPRVTVHRAPAAEIPLEAASSVEALEQDFIEIYLVGEDNLPIGGYPYTVTLPNGEERSGTLSARGLARIDGIASGQCKVTFPELDTEAWRLAEG